MHLKAIYFIRHDSWEKKVSLEMHEPFFRPGKAVANVTAKYKLGLTSYEFFRPSDRTASAHKERQVHDVEWS